MHWRRILAVVAILGAISVAADPGVEQQLAATLKAVFPDLEITRISESTISGLYEVMLGPEVIYATADGRYVIKGDILDVKQSRNLSEDQRMAARKRILHEIPADEFIEFAPEHPKYTAYVFTDISCAYCRRLHQEMPQLNKLGIAVRYLAFPRHGLDDAVSREMEAVWCAADRKQALTDAKRGRAPNPATCKNPVSKQFNLGRSMGVSGTPAIFSENGQEVSGYLPPKEFLRAVEGK